MSTRASRQSTNESRIIDIQKKDKKRFIKSLRPGGDESLTGIGSSGSESEAGGAPNVTAFLLKPTELGDITSPLVIDFLTFDARTLIGNVNGNLTITFLNIPTLLEMTLRLYIRSTDPIITIDGTIASGTGSSPLVTTAVDDFLDISLSSINQVDVIIGTVKKNDKTEEPPGLPLNVQAVGNSASTINVIWDPPITGTQPITYDVAFSLSAAGSAANGPDTHAPGSPNNDLTSNEHNITGLVSATTYYVWIRAKNSEGNSDWLGPFQTNTEGISNPAGVNFAIPGGSLLWNSVTATWDQPGGALFSLTRTATVTGEIEQLQDFDVSDADVVDNIGISPNTNYDYKLTVFNGFGTEIGSGTINITTPDLPIPVLVLTNVNRQLRFTISFLANIGIADYQWSTSPTFASGNSSIRNFARSLPFDVSDQFIDSPSLAADTLFYGRVRFNKNGSLGPWSTIQSATTGTLLPPSQPTITVTSPATGQARIKVLYNDSPTRDEMVIVTWRLASSVQEYFETIYKVGTTTIDNTYDRNEPPSDDLNPVENRVEVIREGAFPNGVSITFRAVCVNASGQTSPADTVNAIINS